VRAIEDPALVERLVAEGVTLNVCPTSNVITGLYPSVAEHPVGALVAAGVPVTVNSDDPMSMDVSLNSELADTAEAFGWGMDELVGVTRTAIDATFCDAVRKDALHAELVAHVAAHGAGTAASGS
jgi:adenosine deaminase